MASTLLSPRTKGSMNAFMKKHKLKNEATDNIKISEVINKLNIGNDFDIYLKNDTLTTNSGIINLSKSGTHWTAYYNNFYFDSFGVKPPKNIEKQLAPVTYSTFKIQKRRGDNKCASYCLYFLYLCRFHTPREAVFIILNDN